MIEVKSAILAPEAPPPIANGTASAVVEKKKEEKGEEEWVFRSRLPDIEIDDHMLLHEYCLLHRIDDLRDRPCLIEGVSGKVLSYGDVESMSRKVCRGLAHKMGLSKGDVMMILLSNSVEFVISFLGASMAGLAVTTANPFYTSSDILKQSLASGTRLIITSSACVPKLTSLISEHKVNVLTVDTPAEGCLPFSDLLDGGDCPDDDKLARTLGVHVDDTVALPYSSGTTGLPKGVMLTHRSLVTSVAQQVDGDNPNLHITPDDVVLCVLPLFHIYSLNSVLLCSLRAGAAVLLLPKFEMGTLLSAVHRHRLTIAAVVPPIVLALAKSALLEAENGSDSYDLSSVRKVLSGAAPLSPELEQALRQRLPNATFGQGYGMTEAGPVLSMCLGFAKHPLPNKFGSCGAVVRNAQMKIVDLQSGASLPRNQAGEICIRGNQIMKGYLNDPEATARTIDADGWLHTGDVGYIDDDDEVFIVDRVKEIIKFKGFQVPPAELEALLVGHPAIRDAAVVPLRDEMAGELPVAFVVKAEGEEVTEEEVKQYIAKQVVYYKRLHRVHFTSAIPKSPAGKILRRELRDGLNSCQARPSREGT